MIDVPNKCEWHSVIHFLQAEAKSATGIHWKISQIYGVNFMSDGVVPLERSESLERSNSEMIWCQRRNIKIEKKVDRDSPTNRNFSAEFLC